jgi:soluble lytic murein transglycosylase-like protein
MKVAVLTLFLGCTAAVCLYAVRSNFSNFEQSTLAEFPKVRCTLNHLGFGFPTGVQAAELPQPANVQGLIAKAAPIVSKAECLMIISLAAAKHQVPAAFVTSIVAAESNFDPGAISPKGAIGLMQLMPETAQQFGADPKVPAQNIDAGTRYLRWLMDRYQTRRDSIKHVIAAYNAGPGMVDRYRGIPPFRETRNYVVRVLGYLKQYSMVEFPKPGGRG